MAYMSTEHAAEIRANLKKAFPGWKLSVTKRHHSSICVDIIESIDVDFTEALNGEKYKAINHYYISNSYQGEQREALLKMFAIINAGNFDKSDRQSDYFHVGFYVDMGIGTFEKPYTFKGKSAKVAEPTTLATKGVTEVFADATGEVHITSEYGLTVQQIESITDHFNFLQTKVVEIEEPAKIEDIAAVTVEVIEPAKVEIVTDYAEGLETGKHFHAEMIPQTETQTAAAVGLLPANVEPVTPSSPFAGLKETARRAFYWTSFNPEGRGDRTIAEHERLLAADLAQVPDNYKAKYTEKFIAHFSGWLHSHSRCASSAVTGGSGFNVRRAEKTNNAENNKYEAFTAWRERILAKLARSERKRELAGNGGELGEAVRNLESRKASHERMKAINATIRKHHKNEADCVAALALLKVSESDALSLLHPKYSYQGQGVPQYMLSNNLAQIKRLEDRVKQLQAKETVKEQIQSGEAETPIKEINGAKIVKDFTDDRLKIEFPGKPAPEVIKALKSHGFRWSPFLKAWCRKLTAAAAYDAERVCKAIAA